MQERQKAEPVLLLCQVVKSLRPSLWPRISAVYCPSNHVHAALLLLSGTEYGAVIQCQENWLIADVPASAANEMVFQDGTGAELRYMRLASTDQPLSEVAALILAYA